MSTVYLPNITKTLGGPAGWVTPFYAQNVGNTLADVVVSFYRFSDGSLVTCRTVRGISPGEVVDDNPNADPDLPDSTQFSVVIASFGAPVVAVVNQLQGSGSSTEALSYSGFSSGATKVYLPNVTRRFYGYDVPFIVQNMGSANASVTASFVSFDATQRFTTTLSIAPGRSGVIDPDFTDGLVDGTQYAVTLTSTQPIGVVVNAHDEAIGPVAFSHNGLANGGTTLYAPYAMKDGPAGIFSPVVVQNVGATPVDATLSFVPLGTGGTAQTFTLTAIPAGGSRAFDPRFTLGTSTPCATASATCLGSGEYSLKITAPTAVAAVVLPNSSVTAAGYLAAASVDAWNYLPIVHRSIGGATGWTGTIYLQSAGATSAVVRYLRMPGYVLDATQFVTLTNGVTTRLDPRTVSGLLDNAVYGVVIQSSSGNVASAVYEQAFGGGDAAMMYEGLATPAPKGPFISGTVSGPAGPIPGVSVQASAGGWIVNSAATDQSGNYQISVPSGTFAVRAVPSASSRLPVQYYPGVNSLGESTPVPVTGTDVAGINITLPAGYYISGRVTSQSGAPLAAASAFAYRSTCSTCGTSLGATADANGNFRIAVPAGTYRVHVNPAENAPFGAVWWQSGTSFSTATDVVVNTDVANINASLPGRYRIIGTVRDSGGRPEPGVTVRARLGGAATCCTTVDTSLTDAYGQYTIVVPSGSYRLSFVPPGYAGLANTWYGSASSFLTSPDVTVTGADVGGIDATLGSGKMLYGLTTYSGIPIIGVTVQVYLGSGSSCCNNLVYTGSSDVYAEYMVGLAPGTYRIRFLYSAGTVNIDKWYPSGTSFSTAADVVISGDTRIDGNLP